MSHPPHRKVASGILLRPQHRNKSGVPCPLGRSLRLQVVRSCSRILGVCIHFSSWNQPGHRAPTTAWVCGRGLSGFHSNLAALQVTQRVRAVFPSVGRASPEIQRGQPSSVLFLRGLRRKTKELISDHEMGPWSLAGFLSLLLDVLSGHLDRVLASTCSSHHQ